MEGELGWNKMGRFASHIFGAVNCGDGRQRSEERAFLMQEVKYYQSLLKARGCCPSCLWYGKHKRKPHIYPQLSQCSLPGLTRPETSCQQWTQPTSGAEEKGLLCVQPENTFLKFSLEKPRQARTSCHLRVCGRCCELDCTFQEK